MKRRTVAICMLTSIGLLGLHADAVPVDPVVEEPLRPLLPDGSSDLTLRTTSCGSADIVPLAGLAFLGLQLGPARNRRATQRTT